MTAELQVFHYECGFLDEFAVIDVFPSHSFYFIFSRRQDQPPQMCLNQGYREAWWTQREKDSEGVLRKRQREKTETGLLIRQKKISESWAFDNRPQAES